MGSGTEKYKGKDRVWRFDRVGQSVMKMGQSGSRDGLVRRRRDEMGQGVEKRRTGARTECEGDGTAWDRRWKGVAGGGTSWEQ